MHFKVSIDEYLPCDCTFLKFQSILHALPIIKDYKMTQTLLRCDAHDKTKISTMIKGFIFIGARMIEQSQDKCMLLFCAGVLLENL